MTPPDHSAGRFLLEPLTVAERDCLRVALATVRRQAADGLLAPTSSDLLFWLTAARDTAEAALSAAACDHSHPAGNEG